MSFDKQLARLVTLTLRTDLKAIRLLLSVGALLIGLGFAWPVDTFPTASQIISGNGRHTYSVMAQIAPEWAWSMAFLLQGGVMLWSLLTGYQSKILLWLDAAFGVVLWTTAIGACYLAYWDGVSNILNYRPPAIMGGEVAAVLAQWWVFVRYHCGDDEKHDRRRNDRRITDHG